MNVDGSSNNSDGEVSKLPGGASGTGTPGIVSEKPAGAAAESVNETSEAGQSDQGSKPVPEAAAGEQADMAPVGHPVSAQVVFYDQPTFPGHFYVADCRRWMSVVRGGVEDGSDGSEGLDEEGLGGGAGGRVAAVILGHLGAHRTPQNAESQVPRIQRSLPQAQHGSRPRYCLDIPRNRFKHPRICHHLYRNLYQHYDLSHSG
ncbi:unnamed protein product [Closterium sp. Yama58-4]|nr:unnamed protein product [Closterium sp. Yama58-4]